MCRYLMSLLKSPREKSRCSCHRIEFLSYMNLPLLSLMKLPLLLDHLELSYELAAKHLTHLD